MSSGKYILRRTDTLEYDTNDDEQAWTSYRNKAYVWNMKCYAKDQADDLMADGIATEILEV